jgi:hypothetical protein
MRSYKEAAELARICAHNARYASTRAVAVELWRMAEEYQAEAAKLKNGKMPDIGDVPAWLADQTSQ